MPSANRRRPIARVDTAMGREDYIGFPFSGKRGRERGKAYRLAVIATAQKLPRVLIRLVTNRTTFQVDYEAPIGDSWLLS